MRNYEDLLVWRKAHSLTLEIYENTRCFPTEERFGLTSQIRRSCSSIGANIAEGCGRRPDAEMARFVQIAMGSGAELSYHFAPGQGLGFAFENVIRTPQVRTHRSHADVIFTFTKAEAEG